jgi:diguanylate cyclase (GGDEF)-like protein/PAS domain S-box-containing protein
MARFDDPEILRSVMENLPTGLSLVGRDGRILFWNYGAERITGHLRQDVVGHLCREDFLASADANSGEVSGGAAALDAVLKDGRVADSRVSLRHKSGQLVAVRLRATAIRDGEGAIIGVAECFDEIVDITAWDGRQSKLAEYGCLDEATGVLTHKVMESRLKDFLGNHADLRVPFCIVCISFDRLEEIKARYGLGGIAAVLRVCGQTLQSSLRPTDHLGRWQENEFLAIAVECNSSEVPKVGERLKKMISQAKIMWWGEPLPVTISMGATEVQPGDSFGELMGRAEGALNESIQQGGNRIIVWTTKTESH